MTTLAERLDRLRASFAEKIPAEAKAVMAGAEEALRASGIMDGIPAVGSPLPAFALPDTEGSTADSAALLAKGPLVLTFYRGVW